MNAPRPLDLQEEVAPPRWRQVAFRLRFVLVALYVLALAGATVLLAVAFDEWLAAAIALLILVGAQALFLVGMPQARWPKPTGGVSMTISMVTGALIAGLLTFGTFAALLNITTAWERLTNAVEVGIFWVIAAAWAAWFFVFLVMWAG